MRLKIKPGLSSIHPFYRSIYNLRKNERIQELYRFLSTFLSTTTRRDDFSEIIGGRSGGRGSWREDKWDSHVPRRARFPLGFQEYERRLTYVARRHRRKCEFTGGGGGFPGGSRAKRPCLWLLGGIGRRGHFDESRSVQETTSNDIRGYEVSRHVWEQPDALKPCINRLK